MDRPAIEELFAYTGFSWRQYEETVRALGEEMLARPAPGSGWPALRNALGHILFGYDRWLAILTGTSPAVFDAGSARSWEDLEQHRREVRGRFRDCLDALSDAELTAPREMNVDGETLRYSPAEILTHLLLHERGHHGDISTLLYQLGVEPPVVEYRFFLPQSRP